MRTVWLTIAALVGFSANSILCRLALGAGRIDAASFTLVRIASGAAILAFLVLLSRRRFTRPGRRALVSALALFAYAILFSYAYLTLTAGTGALLLFGAVQVTMITVALWHGERPRVLEWVGLLAAFAGLVVLVVHDLASPEPLGALFMVVAGAAWGTYTLAGRGVTDPMSATALNFAVALPLAAIAGLLHGPRAHVTLPGAALAAASGAIASGLGYALWFAALRGLSATRAATVQLSVPVITALAGVLLLGETITMRLVFATVLILGGVLLATRSPQLR